MPDTPPSLHVPARDIPVPRHLSPQAQAQFAMGTMGNPLWPEVDDADAWRALVASMDTVGAMGLGMMAAGVEAEIEELEIGGARVFSITPAGVDPADPAIYLDVHGGALLWGGGESCRLMGLISAGMMRSRVWAVDYRMPPDHPYPAGVDDCLAAYRGLLGRRDPADIVIGGPSAGGNIAAATILRARDEGLPLPAAAVLLTPEIDLTEAGDSFNTNLGVDTALSSRLMPANLVYAGGHDLTDPYVSPIFGDFTKGFPPTLLQTGTRDLFLSNTVRLHTALRAAGIEADLHVFEAATHIMFMSGPEHDHQTRMIRAFVDRHWRRTGGC